MSLCQGRKTKTLQSTFPMQRDRERHTPGRASLLFLEDHLSLDLHPLQEKKPDAIQESEYRNLRQVKHGNRRLGEDWKERKYKGKKKVSLKQHTTCQWRTILTLDKSHSLSLTWEGNGKPLVNKPRKPRELEMT